MTTANLKNITVRFSRNALVAVTGESGSGKTALVVKTLAAESERYLRIGNRALERQTRPSRQDSKCEAVAGLLPVIELPTSGVIVTNRSVAEFAGLIPLIDQVFNAQGERRCRNCSSLLYNTAPAMLAEQLSRSGSSPHEGVLLVGAYFDSQRLSSVSSKKNNILKYFERKGLRRFVVNDTLYRFDNASLTLKKTDSLVVCNDSLPSGGTGKALMLNAFAHALSLGSEIGVVIEYAAGKVGRRWYFAHDPFCPNCFQVGLDLGQRMLDGISWEALLKLRIDELLMTVPTLADVGQLAERLGTLCRLGLGSTELGRNTGEISAGEALKLQIASALFRELSETIYVLDEPSRVLHPFDLALVTQELRGLVAAGCGVIVIDRNVDFVRGADEVIELGGMRGGELLFNGPGSEWRIS